MILIICAIISYNNKTLDKYIFGSSDLKNTNLFAIMIEDSDGNYNESSASSFPSYDYYYNHLKSNCVDLTGNQIEDSLLYNQDTKTATVTIGETSGCYLYFDNWEEVSSFANDLINSGNLWQSGLEGDGYRYVGSGAVGTSANPNNFICFGTKDKSTCTANQDKYMYRIIGVFSDENGNQHIKLIKYKQLGATYVWNADRTTDISWENSDMYKGLNGSYFFTNTTYDYLQDTTWSNKIENWTWSAVNTSSVYNGPKYYSINTKQVYLHEMNRTEKTSTVGTWTTPTGKIGLMYVSDYQMSLGSSALALTGSSNYDTLKTGWMHQSNNDTTKSSYEWTLSRAGVNGSGWYNAWFISNDGGPNYTLVNNEYGVRPVFYLTLTSSVSDGNGSLESPFIISKESNDFSVNVTKESNKLIATITKGIGNPVKYCINSSESIANCTWNNITSTTINYTMSEKGTYYVHVIDDAGYIVHGSLDYLSMASQLIKSGDLWQSGLEGDGYRYIGSGAVGTDTNPDNFICFGTNDKSECTANQDKYMYRVIGVFSDANSNEHAKLIKYKQLGFTDWNSTRADVNWEESTLYAYLNVSGFLTNTTYDYMQNTAWSNRIENWTWSAVNTKTQENTSKNVDYYKTNPRGIYLNEMNKTSTGKLCGNYIDSLVSCNTGSWTTPSAKIGLMYVSDYALSLGPSALALQSGTYTNRTILKTGWMHPSNNDATRDVNEWTIASYGMYNDNVHAWRVCKGGYVDYYFASDLLTFRPVFYLTSDVMLSSGTGTLSDPYIIAN